MHLDLGLLPALRSVPALATFAPPFIPPARTGNRRVWLFSALRAHTKAPYRTDLLWEPLGALTRPAGGSRQPIAPRHGRRWPWPPLVKTWRGLTGPLLRTPVALRFGRRGQRGRRIAAPEGQGARMETQARPDAEGTRRANNQKEASTLPALAQQDGGPACHTGRFAENIAEKGAPRAASAWRTPATIRLSTQANDDLLERNLKGETAAAWGDAPAPRHGTGRESTRAGGRAAAGPRPGPPWPWPWPARRPSWSRARCPGRRDVETHR